MKFSVPLVSPDYVPGAALDIGDQDGGSTSLPSEHSGQGGIQGLGFKSGRTTWVLNRSTRVTLRSREEKLVILAGDAGKSGMGGGGWGPLSWLQKDEYKHQQEGEVVVFSKHQKVLETQRPERCHFHASVALTTIRKLPLGSIPQPLIDP